MSETVTLSRDGATAYLTLNRPEIHNAFDDALIAELTAQLRDLNQDARVRAVVLTGTGKSFSAGADLNWMSRMAAYTEAENRADALALADLMETLDTLRKPVIGRIQGSAFGGGVGLVACCDLVVAAEHARFALPEVRLGLIPAAIAPYVLAAMGERAARRYFISGERFDAATAAQLGLVHQTAPAEELDAAVNRWLEGVLSNGPRAMAEAKALVRTVAEAPRDDDLRRQTADWIAALRVGDEGQEGLNAFLEKRAPQWQQPS